MAKAGVFFGHGTDCALDEAAFLVLTALGLPPSTAGAGLNRIVSETQRENVTRLVEQRIKTRQPAAYLVREAWFVGLPFYVDERGLVPRSPGRQPADRNGRSIPCGSAPGPSPISEIIGSRFAPWLSKREKLRILG